MGVHVRCGREGRWLDYYSAFGGAGENREQPYSYITKSLTDWLDAKSYKAIHVRTDSGPALKAIFSRLRVARSHETRLEHSAVGSSQSVGSAGRAVRKVKEQFRILRSQGQLDNSRPLLPTHVTWPWLIRHLGWVSDRFAPMPSGRTPDDTYADHYCTGEA